MVKKFNLNPKGCVLIGNELTGITVGDAERIGLKYYNSRYQGL